MEYTRIGEEETSYRDMQITFSHDEMEDLQELVKLGIEIETRVSIFCSETRWNFAPRLARNVATTPSLQGLSIEKKTAELRRVICRICLRRSTLMRSRTSARSGLDVASRPAGQAAPNKLTAGEDHQAYVRTRERSS